MGHNLAMTTPPTTVGLSEEARAALARMRAERGGPDLGIEEGRAAWRAAALADPPPPGTTVEVLDLGGVPAERVALGAGPKDGSDDGAGLVVLLHGGGFTAGSPVTHRKLAAHLSAAAGCPVVVPAYRLAPEHPAPAALDDALAAWAALAQDGPVALAGDSAGGGLAVALTVAARDRGLPLPAAVALMSPWVDLVTGRGASYAENADADPSVTGAALDAAARLYAGGRDVLDLDLSPVEADLSGLPPLLAQVGGLEVLRDDATRLVARARAAGVEATCEVWPGLWHVWHLDGPSLPEARDAVDRLGAFLARRLR